MNKTWSKLISYFTKIEYEEIGTRFEKGIECISTIDKDGNRLIEETFYVDGKLKSKCIYENNIINNITYDKNGNEISNEISEFEDDSANRKDIDSFGNITEELFEYDVNNKVIKQLFLENGIVNSYLYFFYDKLDRSIRTDYYENENLQWYKLHEYTENNIEEITQFDKNNNIKERTIWEIKDNDKLTSLSTFNELGELVRRIEEKLDSENNPMEQKIFNKENELIKKTIFEREKESNNHKKIITIEYKNDRKIKEEIIENVYEY